MSTEDNAEPPAAPSLASAPAASASLADEDRVLLLESAPFIVTLLDAHTHVIRHVNRAGSAFAREVLGVDDVRGLPIAALGIPEASERQRVALDEVRETGDPDIDLGSYYIFRNGAARYFDGIAFPLRDPAGRIDAIVQIVIDVTERMEAAQAQATQQRVRDLEALNDIARTVYAAQDWSSSLDTLIRQIQQRRPCEYVGISTYDAPRNRCRILNASREIPGIYPLPGDYPIEGTLFEQAIRGPRVVYTPDVAASGSALHQLTLDMGLRCFLHIPLIFQGDIQGVLSLARAEQDAFSPQDILFFEQIGTHAAVALHNAARIEERDRVAERQRRLTLIGNATTVSTDLPFILRMIYDAVREIGGFDRVGVFLYDTRRELLTGVYGTSREGRPEDISGSPPTPLSLEARTGHSAGTTRLLRGEIPYYLRENYGAGLPPGRDMSDVRHHAEVSLRAQGQTLGMISVDNLLSGRPIVPADVEALIPFCEQAATAIHTARLLEERDRMRQTAERQAQRAETVNAIVQAAISTLDPDAVIARVMTQVRALGDFQRISITRRGYAPDEWRVVAVWPEDPTLPAWAQPGGTQTYSLLERRLPRPSRVLRYRRDVRDDPDARAADVERMKIGSVLNVDLWVDDQCLGHLNLSKRDPDAFTEEEFTLFETLAPSLALAIYNADLYRSLKEAQDALIRAETLRAVGELATGVAHNVNNLLAAVLGYAELILTEADDPSAVRRDAGIIAQAALDGANIMQRVQRFSRRAGAATRETVDVALIVEEALQLTRSRWRDEAAARGVAITLSHKLTPGLLVSGHPTELREVFVNLIVNACDAMPQGGELTLRCAPQNQYARIEIEDTGIGMDAATQKRIFEPFFTTKGLERGQGLGLAVSWGMVDRHGGRIEVRSTPGQGATFSVLLPLCRAAAAAPLPVLPDVAPLRILLVEDEESVRDVLTRSLTKAGMEVFAAPDGAAAVAWLEANGARCDVIISDHGMAGMTGLELLAQTRAIWPDIRRVLLSGWGALPPREADLSAAQRVLSKPITIQSLLTALGELIAAPPDE